MKIAVLDGYTSNPGDLSWEAFEELGELTVHDRTKPEEVVSRCAGCEVVFTNKVVMDAGIMDQLPDLKYIGVLATGTNVIDLEHASQKGICVTNIPGYSTDSVVQHILAFMLHFSSMVSIHNDAVHQEDWVNSKDFCFTLGTLSELSGSTLGIIGLGTIGRKLARVADAMGMKIIAAHQSSMNRLELPYELEWLPVDEVFARADFLSLNCPLTPETDRVVNAERLQKMKSSAVLINTGRGPLVDEQALGCFDPRNDCRSRAGCVEYRTTFRRQPVTHRQELCDHATCCLGQFTGEKEITCHRRREFICLLEWGCSE